MMPSNTRSDVQPMTRAATLMFLNRHLKLASGNESELSVATLRRYLRGAVDSVSVLTKPAAKTTSSSTPPAAHPARRGNGAAARGLA